MRQHGEVQKDEEIKGIEDCSTMLNVVKWSRGEGKRFPVAVSCRTTFEIESNAIFHVGRSRTVAMIKDGGDERRIKGIEGRREEDSMQGQCSKGIYVIQR